MMDNTMADNVAVGHRTRVYVAGPYTKGDVALNVKEAVRASDELLKLGYAPYCPHLTHFWHMLFEHEYQTWLDLDNEWVTCCDALLRIPGDSSGADKEVALAESLGIPVFFSVEEFAGAVPVVRPEGGIPDREAMQLEAMCRSDVGELEELPRGIPEGVSVVASQPAAGAFQYNSELPKGVPAEVTVEPAVGAKPEPGTPARSLEYTDDPKRLRALQSPPRTPDDLAAERLRTLQSLKNSPSRTPEDLAAERLRTLQSLKKS